MLLRTQELKFQVAVDAALGADLLSAFLVFQKEDIPVGQKQKLPYNSDSKGWLLFLFFLLFLLS